MNTTKKIVMMMAMAFLCLNFSSCNKDDDNKDEKETLTGNALIKKVFEQASAQKGLDVMNNSSYKLIGTETDEDGTYYTYAYDNDTIEVDVANDIVEFISLDKYLQKNCVNRDGADFIEKEIGKSPIVLGKNLNFVKAWIGQEIVYSYEDTLDKVKYDSEASKKEFESTWRNENVEIFVLLRYKEKTQKTTIYAYYERL